MSTENKTVKGLLGTKLGMTQVWDENNKLVPVTVIEAGSNVVTQIKNAETDGYSAIQVAYGVIDPRKVTKPEAGLDKVMRNIDAISHVDKRFN